MPRYDSIDTIKNKFGKNIISTNIIKIPTSTTDSFIEITSPERLDKLSYDFYGTVENWYIIANANQLGRGTLWIPPGTILRIPSISNASEYIRNINKTR